MKRPLPIFFIIILSFAISGCDDGSSSSENNSTISIKYDGNGSTSGTVPVDSNRYYPGASISIMGNLNSLQKTDYLFNGWSTAPDGSGMIYQQGDLFSLTKSTTLYADWIADTGYATRTFRAVNTDTNIFYDCESFLLATGTSCYVYGEKSSSMTPELAQEAADEFDNNIYSQIRTNFGTESDVDGNGKIILLFLDIQDGYTGTGGYVAGYFHSVHEYDTSTFADSNEADMIFLDTYPAVPCSDSSYSVIAHEFQHLINFSTTYFNDGTTQDTWLNEGLSSGAEYVYSGQINASRVNFYSSDPEDTILYGNNFFIWNGYWENNTNYGTLANYATVNLFFQWLRIHADNGTEIYKDILNSSHRDYNAVTQAAATRIDSAFADWSELLATWQVANLLKQSSGYKGYEGLISFSAHGFNSDSTWDWAFSPGEGIFSAMPSGGFDPSLSGTSGANIRYLGISSDGAIDSSESYTGDIAFVFNANTDIGGSDETGYVASGDFNRSDNIAASLLSATESEFILPDSYPVDVQFSANGAVINPASLSDVGKDKSGKGQK